MIGMEENDIKGTKYSYKIFFVHGNLFSGKTAFLKKLIDQRLNLKVLMHITYSKKKILII